MLQSRIERSVLLVFLGIIFFGILLSACGPKSAPRPAEQQGQPYSQTRVTLTFDDGDADNYSIREDLARNSIHATFYIVSGLVGTQGYMSEAELRDLAADGNEIGGHTLHHAQLLELHGEELKHEICQDRVNLQSYGFAALSFAYPGGQITDEAKQAVQDCGYENARVVVDGPESFPPADRYALRGMPYIVDDTRLPKILRYIRQTEKDGGGWVILIFHHICEGCDYYSISPETFRQLADWLGVQQKNGLIVGTIGDMIHQATP